MPHRHAPTRPAPPAPRRQPARAAALLRRLGATAVLVGALVGVPAAMQRATGGLVPRWDVLRSAWTTGRIDDEAVVQIGALLFGVLWLWFAGTVLAEVAHVIATRRDAQRPLAEVSRTPSGAVRTLVRMALLSTAAMVGTAVAPLLARGSATPRADAAWSARSTVRHELVVDVHGTGLDGGARTAPGRAETTTVRSGRRDTPYSIAVRAGDPLLRDRIVALNHGRDLPDGTVWTGGVFPPGFHVVVPVAGDPVVDAVEPDGHLVVRGDSYWRIAEHHLVDTTGSAPPARDVLEETLALRDLNAPILGHCDPDLLLPGEFVRWATTAAEVADAAPAVGAAVTPAVAPAPAEGPARDAVVHVPAPAVSAPAVLAPVDAGPPTDPSSTTSASSATTTTTPVGPTTAVDAAPSWRAPDALDTEHDDGGGSLTPWAIGGSLLLASGAVALVDARRRERLRRATVHSRLPRPPADVAATELALRRLAAPERAMRLDVGLRAAAARLVGHGRHVVAALLDPAGELTLLLDGDAPADAPWRPAPDAADRWVLPAWVEVEALAADARRAAAPCPALVQLGTLAAATPLDAPVAEGERAAGPFRGAHTDVFVDLEAVGLLAVDADPDAAGDVVRGIVAGAACSPVAETVRCIVVGEPPHDAAGRVEHAATLDAALDLAATYLGSTGAVTAVQRTFDLRASAGDGSRETWEPVVVAVTSGPGIDATDAELDDAVALTRRAGRGLAVVVDRALTGATWTLSTAGPDGHWRLDPLGIDLVPARLTREQAVRIDAVLRAADVAPVDITPVDERPPVPSRPAAASPFVERPWSLLVRVLGGVSVEAADGTVVEFARSKSLELVAWLALHRGRPTRGAARTALWEVDVRDATFANVVSDARRAMARTVAPPAGEEWIERTLTEQLPLHDAVVLDADLLRDRVDAAAGLAPADAVAVLEPGLALVRDLPFAGTAYLWPDAEGTTSALVLLATGVAIELARHHLALGDVEGVFRATGAGLRVLPGHEELIALRMRAHAAVGDLAGVRGEWEIYQRTLHADPWSCAEPSPKLVAIRRSLLPTGG